MTTVDRAEIIKRLYELELEDRAVVIGFALMLLEYTQSRSPGPEAAASKMASSAMDLIHKRRKPEGGEITVLRRVLSTRRASIRLAKTVPD